MEDAAFMAIALAEARKAYALEEVPVGAVLVDADATVVACAHNRTRIDCDPTAHAEIQALRHASTKLGNYRLLNTTLYVTVEPCVMCMGAIVHARLARLVFGATDPKWGGAVSLYQVGDDPRLNHRVAIAAGVLEAECRELIQKFFRERRR
jgi:tRNA(adenine34) deaminase